MTQDGEEDEDKIYQLFVDGKMKNSSDKLKQIEIRDSKIFYSIFNCFNTLELHHQKDVLYGPPGTGKTLLVRVVASQIEANFLSGQLSDR